MRTDRTVSYRSIVEPVEPSIKNEECNKKFIPPENSHEAMADNKPRDHRAGSAPMSPMTAPPADARHRLSAGDSIVVPPAPPAQSSLQLPRWRSRKIE